MADTIFSLNVRFRIEFYNVARFPDPTELISKIHTSLKYKIAWSEVLYTGYISSGHFKSGVGTQIVECGVQQTSKSSEDQVVPLSQDQNKFANRRTGYLLDGYVHTTLNKPVTALRALSLRNKEGGIAQDASRLVLIEGL